MLDGLESLRDRVYNHAVRRSGDRVDACAVGRWNVGMGSSAGWSMTRQEFVLAVLAAGNGASHNAVQLLKLFFILDRKVPSQIGGPWFNFHRDAYGPFDEDVFDDVRALAAKDLAIITSVRNGPHGYRATAEGVSVGQRLLAQLPPATAEYIRELSAWVRNQSFFSLMSYIYHEFPDMREGSVFAEVK